MDKKLRLNDCMNLRDLIAEICDFIRENGTAEAQPKNIVGFLAVVLTGADNETTRKESSVVTMQRVMSGNIPYGASAVQKLAEEICSGDRDAELTERLSYIARTILDCPGGADFFGRLLDQCSFRFFSRDELKAMRELSDREDYPQLLSAFLKHAFATLYNLPCCFAQRMYAEATTCDWDSPHRFALLKLAADSGSKDAAYEYANYLARRYGSDSDADRYFMAALPKPEAMWSLANRIEIRWIGQSKVPGIRNALRIEEKIAGPEFEEYRSELEGAAYGGTEPDRAETAVFLYNVFFYLAYQGFFKGFHSMAKQLETGTIRFDCPQGEAKASRLLSKYRTAAVKASNVISVLAEGTSALRELMRSGKYDPSSAEERQLSELLELAADTNLFFGNYRLGEYYEYAGGKDRERTGNMERAREYYLRAERLDANGDGNGGRLWMRLAMVSDTPEEKRKYLEKALSEKQWDAAYHLAEMESQRYLSGGRTASLHLFNAAKLLKDYLPLISEKNAKAARLLYSALVSSLEADEDDEESTRS